MMAAALYGVTTESQKASMAQDAAITADAEYVVDLDHLLYLTANVSATLCICSCGWCSLSRCMCQENEFSGAAPADPVLQQRIAERAEELSTRMRTSQLKPTWKEYILLHVEMVSFFFDLASDGLCAWRFFELKFYWLFGFQAGIIIFTFWAQSRVMRKLGDICAWYHAFAESSNRGWPTDTYLSIVVQEKLVEAPLASMLSAYAVMWLPPPTGTYDALLMVGKTLTSTYSSCKSAYNLLHLGPHLDAVVKKLEPLHGRYAARLQAQRGQAPQPPSAPPQVVGHLPPAAYPLFPPGIQPVRPEAVPESVLKKPLPADAGPPGLEFQAVTAPAQCLARCPAQEDTENLGAPGPRPSMPPLPGFGANIQVGVPRGVRGVVEKE